MTRRTVLAVALALLAVAVACEGDSERGAVRPTTTSSTTTAPSTTTTGAPAVVGAACNASDLTRARPRRDITSYEIDAEYRPDNNVVVGDLTARFTPDKDTDRVVMRLWPNGPESVGHGGKIELAAAFVDDEALPLSLENPTTAFVTKRLPAGDQVRFRVHFTVTLPVGSDDRLTRQGNVVRLGSWLPLLPWEPGVGWSLEPPTTSFAEASLSVHANFSVRLRVPDDLQVLGSGGHTESGRWVIEGAPDWAAVIGEFRYDTADVGGVEVIVAVAQALGESPAAYLNKVVASLTELARRYGDYPWPVYRLVLTPGMRGGIEYPGLVMQGPNTNARTTPHEVAHQWFYALVGSNQGRDPWLDEGISTWAEAQINGTFADFRSRAIPSDGRNRIGEPMTFWDAHRTSYYRSVYVQGMQALASLGVSREAVDCALARYVAANAYRVATPKALASALQTVAPNAVDVLTRFGAQRVA